MRAGDLISDDVEPPHLFTETTPPPITRNQSYVNPIQLSRNYAPANYNGLLQEEKKRMARPR
jgi:hypothetical protein